MLEQRRKKEVYAEPASVSVDASPKMRAANQDFQGYRLETSNDNSLHGNIRQFNLSLRQMTYAIAFGVGAVFALFAMLNGSAFYEAESRIYVDTKQAQMQAATADTLQLDIDDSVRIVNEKLLSITSQPVLEKVVENLGLQRVQLFETAEESDVLTAFAGWYRSFFQKEPIRISGSENADPIEQMDRAITLTPDEETNVIAIKVTTTNARTSTLIANQLAEVMKATENKPAPVTSVTQVDLDAMLEKVQQADRAVAEYQVQPLELDQNDQMSELGTELSETQSKIQSIQKTIEILKKSSSAPSVLNSVPEDLMSSKILGLRAQLSDAQNKIIELSQSLGPKHPDLLAAKKAVDGLNADVKKEIPVLIKGLDAELANKKAAETLLSQEIEDLKNSGSNETSQTGATLDDLQKRADTLHAQYASMLLNGPNKKATDPVIRLVSKAQIPTAPIRSGFGTTILAMIVGGFIGMGFGALTLLGKNEFQIIPNDTQPRYQDEPQPRYREYEREEVLQDDEPDDELQAYFDELSQTEAALEAREKELELKEFLLLNSRLERLASLLDRASDGLAVETYVDSGSRHYPRPSEDLHERVISQAANNSAPLLSALNAELENARELDRVRDDLRALRGRVIRYANHRSSPKKDAIGVHSSHYNPQTGIR